MTRENEPRNTWTEFAARHSMGDVLRATVTKTVPFGALIDAEGVPGLSPALTNSTTATASRAESGLSTRPNSGSA